MENPTQKTGGAGLPSGVKTESNPSNKPSSETSSEHGPGYRGPTAGSLLGPDGEAVRTGERAAEAARQKAREVGRQAGETWGDVSTGLTDLVERNPMMSAVASLSLGLIVGMIVGAAVARD